MAKAWSEDSTVATTVKPLEGLPFGIILMLAEAAV